MKSSFLNKSMKNFNKYYNSHKFLLLMFALFVIFFIFALYYKNDLLNTQRLKENFNSPYEGSFTMYHADWCPHCKNALPDFNNVISNSNDYTKIKCEAIESEQDEFLKLEDTIKDKIQGFPTYIYCDKKGKCEVYSGGRDKDSIKEFLMSKSPLPS